MKLGTTCIAALWLSTTASAFTVTPSTKNSVVRSSNHLFMSSEEDASSAADESLDDFRKGMSLMRGFKKDGSVRTYIQR